MNWRKCKLIVMVHNQIGHTPFILTIITAIVVYGVMLSVYAASFGHRWADWYFAIWSWALFVFVTTVCGLYMYKLLTKRMPGWRGIIGFVDAYVAFAHAIAAVGMSIYALDTSPTRDTYIGPVGQTGSPYGVFVADFLNAAFHVLVTAGYVETKPRPGQPIGAIWGIMLTFSTLFMISFVFSTIVGRKADDGGSNENEENKNSPMVVKAGFTADYGGVFNHGKGATRRMRAPGPNHILRDDISQSLLK